jgi:DNA modification methylase
MAKRKLAEKPILTKITPYAKNAKKHPQAQLKQLAASLREFGWRQPVVVDKNNTIIVGHGRMLAYETFPEGINEPWIVEAHDLTPTQAKAYRLADNKLNESDWDMALAVEELKELDAAGFDIEITGFDKDLLLEADAKDDVVPENAPPVAKLGSLWALGEHRVLCGDSTDKASVERLMGQFRADMILIDPPYNVDYTGKTKDALKIENDKKQSGAYRDFLIGAFQNLDDALKPGGVFYIWHADSEGLNVRLAADAVGWKTRQCLIWNKNVMVMGRQDYHWKHEPCLYGWKDGSAHLWNSDRTQTTVLNFERPSRSESHPTMKPVELMAYQMTNNTKGKDIVLDGFLGSGSTLIAAEKTGRICYGLELDPKYVDVIIKRWEDYTNLKATQI